MKKILFTLALLVSFSSFSQSTVELDISSKDYKKIFKKLDVKIVNRGYDGSGIIFAVQRDDNRETIYTRLWNEAFFEMDMPVGNITSKDSGGVTIDADYLIEITGKRWKNGAGEVASGGGLSGKIVDFNNNRKVVATFSSKRKMDFYLGEPSTKKAQLFKNYVKVIFNEILLSIK
tara:strand:- start:49 stop:573 length:525 start_codon:yes stop_codon:yes gene_type:complete